MGGRGSSSGAGGGIRNVSLEKLHAQDTDMHLTIDSSGVYGTHLIDRGGRYKDEAWIRTRPQRDFETIVNDAKSSVRVEFKNSKVVDKWIKRIEKSGFSVRMRATNASGKTELLLVKKGAQAQKEKKKPSYVTYKG